MSDIAINQRQVVCVATFNAKPGKRDELVEALASLIPATRREAGCIRYELNISRDDQDKVTFVEKFVDLEAFESHCNKQDIQDYFHKVMPELVASHHVETYQEVIA